MTSTIPDSDADAHRAAGGWFHHDDVCVTDDGHVGYLHSFTANAAGLAALVADADPATPVPWCPGWDLTALAAHVGATHRWVAAMVAARPSEPLRFRPFRDAAPGGPAWAGGSPLAGSTHPADGAPLVGSTRPAEGVPSVGSTHPADGAPLVGSTRPADGAVLDGPELAAWLGDGARALRAAFDAADPDAEMWTWTDQRQVRYWSRRMLHELLIHQSDARAATGAPVRLHAALAADGVHEVLELVPAVTGAGRGGERPDPGPAATFALAAPDARTVWIITGHARDYTWRTIETEHAQWAPPPAMRAADAALTGDAADVHLWLWGRDTGRVEVTGDAAILDRWRAATKI